MADTHGPAQCVAAARSEFDAEARFVYTATLGLPRRRSWAAPQDALTDWPAATAEPLAYDVPLAAAWQAHARLVGVTVTICPAVLNER